MGEVYTNIMVFTNITMNLGDLSSISPPNISLSGSGVLNTIISDANTYSNDLLIFASMFIILIVVYLVLSDKTPFQEFGYSDIRALNISLACAVIIGSEMIMVGWSPNFFAVGMFSTMWLVTFLGIVISENKE